MSGHLDGVGLLGGLELLGLGDPVDVALQVLLHLLGRPQPLEVPTGLSLLLLLRELSGWRVFVNNDLIKYLTR